MCDHKIAALSLFTNFNKKILMLNGKEVQINNYNLSKLNSK